MDSKDKAKQYNRIVTIVSIVVPLLVAALFKDRYIQGVDFSFLPPIYASINGLTAILLIAAIVAIKNKNVALHQKLMTTALVCSAMFLVLYVVYHSGSDRTPYGGTGTIKYIYYLILISHILLSVVIIPLVLFSYVRAITGRIEEHRKLVKWAFPLWLYVAISGVVVYLMIAPYYA